MGSDKTAPEVASSNHSKGSEIGEWKSKLETYEDTLRDKIWGLDVATGLIDIFSSQLKTVPIALVVNGIALIVTAEDSSIRTTGTWIFIIILAWLSVALIAFLVLSLGLPRIQRHVEMSRRTVEKHENLTEDMFREYRERHIPLVGDSYYIGSFFDDTGKVGRFARMQSWRAPGAISSDIQKDMAYKDGDLVKDMDQLGIDVTQFFDALDAFSEGCHPIILDWAASRTDPLNPHFINSAVVALYWFYTRSIQNDKDTTAAQNNQLIDSDGRTFLDRHFFTGDPTDPSDISSLMIRTDLEKKAKEAREVQKKAQAQCDKVLAKIGYEYTGGR